MDFVSDCTSGGKRFRILTLIDVCTRRAPGVIIERSIGGARVVRFLDEVAAKQGYPKAITVDNSPSSSRTRSTARNRGERELAVVL